MDIRKLQRAIFDGLEDVKAQDILVFNTEHLSPLFERVIIATGSSNRQTKALAASVRDAVKAAQFPVLATEGGDNGEWIIVDCGAAVVHLMQPAIREYYRLEEIWGGKPVRMKVAETRRGLVKAEEPDDDEDEVPVKAASKSAAGKGAAGKSAAGKKVAAKKGSARRLSARDAAPFLAELPPPVKAAPSKKTTAASKAAARKTAGSVAPGKAEPLKQAALKKAALKTTAPKAPARKAPVRKTAEPVGAVVQTVVVKPAPRKTAAGKVAAKTSRSPASKTASKSASKSVGKAGAGTAAKRAPSAARKTPVRRG